MLHMLEEVQVIEENEIVATKKSTQKLVSNLKKEAENSEFWFGFEDEISLKKAQAMKKHLEELSLLCLTKESRGHARKKMKEE